MNIETGAATITLALSKGDITITHGDGTTLAIARQVEQGTWSRLIDYLKRDVGARWLEDELTYGGLEGRLTGSPTRPGETFTRR